jgi:16S rRNA (cytidine1402-2'-O)-methyltransferase
MTKTTTGRLYIVATPIGNPGDITLRALEILKNVDAVICEETKEGSSFLKRAGVVPKELIALNEHNETTLVPDLVNRLLLTNANMALISDCGTPVFADPGHFLIQQATQMGIPVSPIPGPSSLMAALSILDFRPEHFYFAGFLPRVSEERRRELTRLRNLRVPIIIMDTPYRLQAVLDDVVKAFGKGHQVTLAADLTQSSEFILRGPAGELARQVTGRKAEFILILHA